MDNIARRLTRVVLKKLETPRFAILDYKSNPGLSQIDVRTDVLVR